MVGTKKEKNVIGTLSIKTWRTVFLGICTFLLSVQAKVTYTCSEDTTVPLWIFFKDKEDGAIEKRTVSKKATLRREKVGFSECKNFSDQPMSATYIREVEKTGAVLRNRFVWGNAASFNVPIKAIPEIEKISFVNSIYTIGKYIRIPGSGQKKQRTPSPLSMSTYGTVIDNLSIIEIPDAHYYLMETKPDKTPGEGVRIAFFDSGFRLNHRCFTHLFNRKAIIGTYDFVDHDTTVYDPDSVVTDPHHPLNRNDQHGSEVLSLVAAYDPPYYCGSAWGAEFILARTEQGDRELHTEEDNWAAAVVWAESLGVDIISSSLGYRTDFEDTVIIEVQPGVLDTVVDYSKNMLDGNTTIVSIAARQAVERGVLIVNASGNELDDWGDTSLSAPSDVEGVVAVGSVNNKKKLSYFSSVGPTSDGRVKPDVLASGEQVALPRIYQTTDITYSFKTNGTSYATPQITGGLALIKQLHPDMDARQLRQQLYRFCTLPENRTYPDTYYGNGIPDMARSCMLGNDEVMISATDENNGPHAGIVISDKSGNALGTTGDDGRSLFRTRDEQSDSIYFIVNGKKRAAFIDAFPCRMELYPCSLEVTFFDEASERLSFTTVEVRYLDEIIQRQTDTEGKVLLVDYLPSPLIFTFSSTGYEPDTLHSRFPEIGLVARELQLHVTTEKQCVVFPTVLHRKNHDILTIKCFNSIDTGTDPWLKASIRSLSGYLVWQLVQDAEGVLPEIRWNGKTGNGHMVAPGSYFVFVEFNGSRYRRKIIIAE